MRCKGSYKNDRICDMCQLINRIEYDACWLEEFNDTVYKQKIELIEYACKHRRIEYDEYIAFAACNKNGHGYGRNADVCKCTLDCEQYME